MNPFVILIALISSGVSIVFIIEAWGYPSTARDMPVIYASIVLLLCTGVVLKQWQLARVSDRGSLRNIRSWLVETNRLRAFAVIILTACYIIAIQMFGYILPTAAFFGIAATINRTVSIRSTVIGATIIVAVISFFFIGFLRLPLELFPDF